MNDSQKNIETAIRLANHLGEKTECITFDAIRKNENGASLYAVVCESGEIRYVVEGETGEMCGCFESSEDAIEQWNAGKTKNPAAVALGSIRTAKKAASSAANGRKGGRPATAIKTAARLHCNDLMMMGQKATKQDAYDWPVENLPTVKGATADKIREALANEIERLAN